MLFALIFGIKIGIKIAPFTDVKDACLRGYVVVVALFMTQLWLHFF